MMQQYASPNMAGPRLSFEREFSRVGISRVLLITDDPHAVAAHRADAEYCGWALRYARCAEDAVETDWAEWTPDVVLFDLLLPRADLYRAIAAVRSVFGAPVAVVVDAADPITATARGDRGVLTLARAGAIHELRHLSRAAVAGAMLEAGPLTLALSSRVARVGRRALLLSADEATTLGCLMASPGEAVSRRALVAALGGIGADLDPRVVDIHVVRLMQAIGDDQGVAITRTPDRSAYVLHTTAPAAG